jgi:Subtilase family
VSRQHHPPGVALAVALVAVAVIVVPAAAAQNGNALSASADRQVMVTLDRHVGRARASRALRQTAFVRQRTIHGIGAIGTRGRLPLAARRALALRLTALPTSELLPAPSLAPVQIVVSFKGSATNAGVKNTLADARVEQVGLIAHTDSAIVAIPGMAAPVALETLRADPDVTAARLDGLAQATLAPNDPYFNGSASPCASSLACWSYQNIKLPAAWNLTTGSAAVTVAVVDTGVNANHEDLAGSVLPGWNFVSNNANAADDNGHGTEVAGTIAAHGNNGVGVAGACWSCKILPVKVLDSGGSGYYSTIANGVYYAADHGANIINLSLAGAWPDPTLDTALRYAVGKGVLVTIAAGNAYSSNPATLPGGYPAYYAQSIPGVISVGAVDYNKNLYSFSNYGSWVEVAASGCAIAVTMSGGYDPNGVCGTSIAAPWVAGLAALMLSVQPDLTPAQLEARIESSTDPVPTGRAASDSSCGGPCTGYGLIDAQTLFSPANTSVPTVSGVIQEGQTLDASPGTWSGQSVNAAYAWQRSADGSTWTPIAGASSQAYQLASADVGATVRVKVTGSNVVGSGAAVSAATGTITAAPDVAASVTSVALGGTARDGQTLTATATTGGSAPVTKSYVWARSTDGNTWTAITGASSSSYTLGSADVGGTVKVTVSASNSLGSGSASATSGTVLAAAPAATGTPMISGTVREGHALNVSNGSFSGTAPLSYGYQWRRNAIDISGASGASYTLISTDIGATISVLVTASNSAGSDSASASGGTVEQAAPLNTQAPSLSGTSQVDQTLSVSTGTWSGDPANYSYLWYRSVAGGTWTPISGATGATYTLSGADETKTVKAAVTASNGSDSARADSAASATVQTAPIVAPASGPSGGSSGGSSSGGSSSGGSSGSGSGGGAQPDLSLEITTDNPPVLKSGVVYRLRVYGKPSWGATYSAKATFTLPEQIQITSVYVGHGPGCTQSGQTLACDLAWVNPGQDVTVIVSGAVASFGVLTATASVWAAGELNTTDNQTKLTEVVADPNAPKTTPPAGGGGSGGAGTPSTPSTHVRAPGVLPKPTGVPAVGTTLKASLPVALHGVSELRYQWQVQLLGKKAAGLGGSPASPQWVAVKGASHASFTVTPGLAGRRLRLLVSVGPAKTARSYVSPATAPVKKATP